ncbi:MAG: group III truncated hemoglobin [Dongiaceae bacterium]
MGSTGRRDGFDRPALAALVEAFYDSVRRDPGLGPIFEQAIAAEGWPEHLARLTDFWASVMLASGAYKGNPMAAHRRLMPALTPALFERWLALFGETADRLFIPPLAAQLRARAERIAESLQLGLFFRPDELAARPGGPPDR